MMRKSRSRGTKTEVKTKGYRSDYIRKKMLQKSFKGNEKGYKPLDKLADTIHTGIEVLWRQSFLCDVEIISADRHHFRAHKIVLATCCDFFYDLLADPESEVGNTIDVPEVRGDVFDLLLEAMYTGRIKTEAGNVDDLLIAANTLGMYMVIDACEDFLLEYVVKENCLQFLATSYKYSLARLTETSLNIAAMNFLPVAKTVAFRNLPVEHLIALLKRDDLNINNELEVFHRARGWIEEIRKSRIQHAAEVLATIRLPLLTPAEIVDNVESCSHLMDVNGCQKLVKEALHYHLMPSRQCLLQSPRTVPRKKAHVCLIVVGGAPRLTSDPVNDKVTRYNSAENRWEEVTSVPEPRHHHAVAVLNGFLYVAGGEVMNDSCSPVNTVHRFDPRNCTWRQVASMINCRQSFQLCVLNNALYAVGGRVSNDELLSAVERYDPALDRWVEVASLSCPRRCVAVGSLAGKLYAVGGSNARTVSSRADRYSPTENKWEAIRPTNAPRFFGHLQAITHFLYLLGGAAIDGRGNVMCVDTIERYSHTTNQWSIISRMRTPRSEAGCTMIKEKIFVVGGYNWDRSERISEVECFDTETETWTSLPQLQQPLTGLAASSLQLFHDCNEVAKQKDLTNNCVKGAIVTKKLQEDTCSTSGHKQKPSTSTAKEDIPQENIKSLPEGTVRKKVNTSENKQNSPDENHDVSVRNLGKKPSSGTESDERKHEHIEYLLIEKERSEPEITRPLSNVKEDNEGGSDSASEACCVEDLSHESSIHQDLSNNCYSEKGNASFDRDSPENQDCQDQILLSLFSCVTYADKQTHFQNENNSFDAVCTTFSETLVSDHQDQVDSTEVDLLANYDDNIDNIPQVQKLELTR